MNLEGLCFLGDKLSKMWGKVASPEGRAVFHKAAYESLEGRQEFSCTVEGLCMTKSTRRWLTLEANFKMWFVPERSWLIVRCRSLKDWSSCRGLWWKWRGGFAIWSFLREILRLWDLSGLKDVFQVFHQLVILSKSEEREEAAACLSEGVVMSWQRVESSAIK